MPADQGKRSKRDQELRIIAESPLFDAAWYISRYPKIVASGLSPHEHYLRKGGAKGFQPSAHFDPAAYVAAHPDAAGQNPILHLHRTGNAAQPSSGAPAEPPLACKTPGDGFPIMARPEGEPDRRRRPVVPRESFGDPFLAVGEAGKASVHAFCRLSGLLPPPGSEGADEMHLEAERLRAAGAWLREGPCHLEDAWYVDGGTRLRLRFAGSEDRKRFHHLAAFQIDPQTDAGDGTWPTGLLSVGEGVVGEGPVFADLHLADPVMPVLLLSRPVSGAKPGDAQAAVLAFPSLLRGGLHYAELAASVPRISTIQEALARSDEALGALLARESDAAAPVAVGRIALAGEIPPGGAGPLADGTLTRWLNTVFGVVVGEGQGHDRPSRASSGVLVLPHDAVPTLSALVTRREDEGAHLGPFLVADPVTRGPRHAVALPAAVAALAELQPQGAEPLPFLSPDGSASGPVAGATTFPLAICFRATESPAASGAPRSAGLKRRFAPSAIAPGDLVVVLFARDADRTANLLEDLGAQTAAPLADVRVVPLRSQAVEAPAADVIARLGERCRVVEPVLPALAARLAAARAAGGRYALLISEAVALPDPHTLETLVTIVEAEGVGAASCLLAEKSFSGRHAGPAVATGGWFPTGISFLTSPAVTFGRPDVLGALPDATYPVAAAGPELVLFRAEALADLDAITPNPVGDAALLQLALANADAGRAHVITTAVRAVCLDPLARRDIPDPAGPGAVPVRRLLEIVDRVTAVREVKG
ncbi:MAG: hypothetical protein AAF913_00140 [Pseudomonadota bacterium]